MKKFLPKVVETSSSLSRPAWARPGRARPPKLEKISPIPIKKTKIRVIGIGGGGGNIVSELAQGVKKATFLAVNTDLQALNQVSRKVERFPLGQRFTRGLGTGMNPEIAENTAQSEKERIKKVLQGQDLVIFIACLGGGTGSGATPVFAKISQSLGNLSYGIFTLPFKFEREKKMEIARKTLENLRPHLNTFTILPNERIFQVIDKTKSLKEAFSAINKSLTQSLEGLIETIYQPGLINIDFSDLGTILSGGRGRLAYLNTFSLSRKEGAAKEVVEKALTSPLYPYGIKGAKGVLFNIVGEKELSLEEVSQISQTISETVNPEAKIIFGISPCRKYQNVIKTTIFATGCLITSCQEFLGRTNEVSKELTQRKIKQPENPSTEAPKSKRKKSKEKAEVRPLPEAEKERSQKKENKVSQKTEEKLSSFSEAETKKEKSVTPKAEAETEVRKNAPQTKKEEKPRKNALQIKKEIEEEERKMFEKEKSWEAPAFLRQKKIL